MLEPLFSVVYILLVASGVVALSAAAVGLNTALVAVAIIGLWAAAAVVWSRARASRRSG